MKKNGYIPAVFFAFLSTTMGAQSSYFTLGPWHMRAISGEVDLLGQYRQLESNINEAYEDQRSTYLLSGFKLNTNSYLWNPDIISLDLNGAYSPELRDEQYIALPDRSEVRTLKKLDLSTTIFNNKPITVSGFYKLDQNYFNRELLTNIRSDTRQWGGMISTNNRVLPVVLSYNNTAWNQEEMQTGRTFTMAQENFQVRASKSFGERDRHELIYAHNDYLYTYAGLNRTHHIIDRAALNNNFWFDRKRKYNFNSRITFYDQDGTTSFRRLEALEGLILDLPGNLRFNTSVDLFNMKDEIQDWDQLRVRSSLRHKLYKSLTTIVYLDYGKVQQQTDLLHTESDIRGGVDLRYTKKIPAKGTLNISYSYFRHHHTAEGETGFLQVFNEEQTLTDGEITMLNKPYIDLSTVVVKDITGAVIYQENFDYLVIARSNYIEIQRIPGGQIPNAAAILVDYTYEQPGSYEYDAGNHRFGASVILFSKLIELYYRYSLQDYPKVVMGDLLTLNYFTQHIYGARLDVGFARAGIEFDNYDSNIIPYKMTRYYLDMNWNIRSRLLITLNGNIRDYRMIADEVDHMYSNVSGRVAYRIGTGTTVSVESGYLNQQGINIDLDLLTARAEIHSIIRKLHLRAGLELYRRIYPDSDFAFNGAYLRVTRKF